MDLLLRRTIGALLFTLLLSGHALRAQSSDAVAGEWNGAISLPSMELHVSVKLATSAGSWNGTIDIPEQHAKGLPLTGISVTPPSVSFAISSIPGAPTFNGTVAPEGTSISGMFKQGGSSFPFKLSRSGTASPGADTTGHALNELRDLIPKMLKEWNVPGVAIAVIHHDSVVFIDGFGYRDVEHKLPVTANTLFAIGSATKAFTTLLLGTLVDEGKLDWDKPVVSYLPAFKLKDSYATEHMTTRDLVTHVSGLPRHDAMWYNSSLTRREIFDRLQYLEPTAELRTKWQYQNLMFLSAGVLAEQITGKSWETLVGERIFMPLGMSASNVSVTDLAKAPDAALAYGSESDTTSKLLPYRNIDQIGPAGAVNSNAVDMAKWVRFQLGNGTFDGKQVISAGTLKELHRPQVVMPVGHSAKELLFNLYAMGWMVEAYRGHQLVHHGGNIDGFTSLVTFMPDDDAGVVILTNMNTTELPTALMLSAYDRLLGFEKSDWNGRLLGMRDQTMALMKLGDSTADNADRVPGTHPSHPLKDYVGEFEHPAYGVMAITMEKGGLKATYNGISSRLEHYHYDVFKTIEPTLVGELKFQFQTDVHGNIDRVSAPLEPTVENILFTRRAPAALKDTTYLKQFVGTYDLAGLKLRVFLDHGVLATQATGQQEMDLAPSREMEFVMEKIKGYSLRFEKEKGAIARVIVMQPNGTFVGKRIE